MRHWWIDGNWSSAGVIHPRIVTGRQVTCRTRTSFWIPGLTAAAATLDPRHALAVVTIIRLGINPAQLILGYSTLCKLLKIECNRPT